MRMSRPDESRRPARGDGEWDLRLRKARLLVFTGGLVALLVAANLLYATALFTRSDRAYCLTCHRLNQPAAFWVPSAMHSPGLACKPCHGVLPGEGGRCGAFSAHSDTVNPNCMGCHPGVLEGKPLGRRVEARRVEEAPGAGEGEVLARWKLEDLMYTWHVGNRVCLCTDCHRNVAHDPREDPTLRNRPRMVYCAACHYHRAKDAYVQGDPLPELWVSPAGGDGGPGA